MRCQAKRIDSDYFKEKGFAEINVKQRGSAAKKIVNKREHQQRQAAVKLRSAQRRNVQRHSFHWGNRLPLPSL